MDHAQLWVLVTGLDGPVCACGVFSDRGEAEAWRDVLNDGPRLRRWHVTPLITVTTASALDDQTVSR